MTLNGTLRWGLVAAMAVLLFILGYDTLRIQNGKVQWLFAGLFLAYLGYVLLAKRSPSKGWLTIFSAGLVLRLLLFFQVPNLSDDYLRYTWDGHVQSMGHNPYAYTPEEFLSAHPDDSLSAQMLAQNDRGLRLDSRRFYSVYPTPYQLIFLAADACNSPNYGNLWLIRGFLLLFECLSFWALWRLLQVYNRPAHSIALYWMNPLIIVEFIGNLHFDGIALFFMLLSMLYLTRDRVVPSALALGLAIATKLNPLFAACVAWRSFGWKRWLLWGGISGLFALIILAVYLRPDNLANVQSSYRLYLYAFHFNSSTLNALRGSFGPYAMEVAMGIFPKLIFVAIVALNFLKGKWGLSERILLAFSIYYLLGTTIHPWYIVVLIPFGLLSDWKFPFVWSYLIVWTYSFYHPNGVEQIGWVVGLEYSLLAVVLYLDFRRFFKKKDLAIPLK